MFTKFIDPWDGHLLNGGRFERFRISEDVSLIIAHFAMYER